MEDHDRVQPRRRRQRRDAQLVVPLLHDHVGLASMAHLGRQRRAQAVARRRLAQRHALVPRLRVARRRVERRHQVHARGRHDSVAGRDGLEDRPQVAGLGPPELVGVGVDHPVSSVLDRSPPGHAGHPTPLVVGVVGLVDHLDVAQPVKAIEDVARAVDRFVVGRHDEVDSLVEVVHEVVLDDVLLVAHEQRHHELHASGSPSRRKNASGTSSTRGWFTPCPQ